MAKVSKSKLLAKLKKRAKGAWSRSREQAPKAKGSQLPGGIIRGVAQLSSYKLDEDKNGNPYFMITGIVKSPEELAGARAMVSHFIRVTQARGGRPGKSVEDKLNELSSDLQLLGIDVEGIDLDDIPDILKARVAEKPHFYFNTFAPPPTKDNPSPGTFVFVQGLAEDWEDDDGEEEPEDEEDDEEPDDDDDDDEEEKGKDTGEDEKSDEDEEPETFIPEKEEVYGYKATAKGAKADCEVTAVQKSRETVSLKRLSDSKTFKNVPWSKLEDAE